MACFKDRLSFIRKEKHKTQKEVSEFLRMAERAYRHYELGEREPTLSKLIAIAEFFDVSTDWLLGLSESPKRAK